MSTEKRDFDKEAATWDEEPRRVKLARDLFGAIADSMPLSSSLSALDFGCGTGLVTLQLAARVGQVTGIDSSQGMLEVLQGKASACGLSNVATRCVDLQNGGQLEGSHDLVVSTMTLHHVPDVASLLSQFAAVLKPGGYIALADLDSEDGSFHGDDAGVFHPGFERRALGTLLSSAGFVEIAFMTAAEVVKPGKDGTPRPFPIFLVTGRLATK